ncbi:MAG: threonine synthase [Bacteroidales bacterium]|nr:threonine synthase [Bacteroidales bacterium]
MKFYSTRDKDRQHAASLKDAASEGLAPDGGLYMPESIPQVDMAEVERLAGISYSGMAAYLAKTIFSEIPEYEIERITAEAYDFPVTLREIGDGLHTLELFHGPTFAFKDFGARFMGRMMGLLNEGEDLTILTATSGDTGSAVAHGFYGVEGVKVVILYPAGKVSPLQEAQMTTLGRNITAIKIDGSFDDCQRLVKSMFNDTDLRSRKRITSANSINILRWIPQSFYYFYGYCMWKRMTGKDMPEIAVPSGNYGNLAGGMLAARMGLPIKGFVAASNANDVIPEYLQTGIYRPRPSVRTVANAMDVGAPSNYERMMAMCGDSLDDLRHEVRGFSCSDDEIRGAIAEIHDRYGYLSDPHSAVGYLATRQLGVEGFWLSTAHAAKFKEVTESATGQEAQLPPAFIDMMSKEKFFCRMSAEEDALKEYLLKI